MGKKGKKGKKGKGKKIIPLFNKEQKIENLFLKKRATTNLRSVLQSIYHDYVNLETTCKHTLTCCKTAMPSINYSEFQQIITVLWNKLSKDEKINLICKSVEYFFKNEYKKWGMDTLMKPCALLDEKGLCVAYGDRPLNCRLYGLWPQDEYNQRVDKFEKAYEQFGLKRSELPLNTQCPNVKRIDESVPLTIELINELFKKLDDLDKDVGEFTTLQVEQKENYRTIYDWLLLKVYGEEWMVMLTTFILAATREQMEDQIVKLKTAIMDAFSKKDLPDIGKSF